MADNLSSAGPPWPRDWLRAVLSLLVLRTLEHRSTYGYAIIEQLRESGIGTVKGGTLYPILGRLEEAGYLTTRWAPGTDGPGRKYFTITEAGRTALADQRRDWVEFTRITTDFLATGR